MNVFVIPSWYPSDVNSLAGVFVRSQVLAMAEMQPQWHQALGTWGHHDGTLSLRSWRASSQAFRWVMKQTPQVIGYSGWTQFVTPALSWTLAVAGGGLRNIMRASRQNLAQACEHLGDVQLMHAHVSFPAGAVAAQLSAETGIPFILTEHMGPFPFAALRTVTGAPRAEIVSAFRAASATVAVSSSLAADIRQCGLPCSHVIPNVVDERSFVPRVLPSPPPFIWLSVASLVHHKGIDLLLRALALWNPPAGTVELRIVGDGPLAGKLKRLANELGVADRVRWLGAVRPEAMPDVFAQCHAFVLASRHETFGVVAAEALMCGKPILTTRCGGPESIVRTGVGRVVNVDDVRALADGLAWMVEHLAEFDTHDLREDALRRFSRAVVTAQLAAVYEAAVAGH